MSTNEIKKYIFWRTFLLPISSLFFSLCRLIHHHFSLFLSLPSNSSSILSFSLLAVLFIIISLFFYRTSITPLYVTYRRRSSTLLTIFSKHQPVHYKEGKYTHTHTLAWTMCMSSSISSLYDNKYTHNEGTKWYVYVPLPLRKKSLCQNVQKFIIGHRVQSVDVDSQSVSNTGHVQAEALEKFNEVHFFAWKRDQIRWVSLWTCQQ